MTNSEVKTLHDEIIDRFGLNKDRLLGFLYNLSATAIPGINNQCVYPINPGEEDIDNLELCLYNKHLGGYVRTGIYFDSNLESRCTNPAMKINKEIYDLEISDVTMIIEQNKNVKKKKQNEQFDRALAKVVSIMPPEQILSTPGCYEALSEEYNNEVLDVVQMYNADPALNNLELKYSSREMLEMLVSDLENLIDLTEDQGNQKVSSAKQTLALAKGFLQNMKQISHT